MMGFVFQCCDSWRCRFFLIVFIIVLFFTYVPFYKADSTKYPTRNDALWRDACDNYDRAALEVMGLS